MKQQPVTLRSKGRWRMHRYQKVGDRKGSVFINQYVGTCAESTFSTSTTDPAKTPTKFPHFLGVISLIFLGMETFNGFPWHCSELNNLRVGRTQMEESESLEISVETLFCLFFFWIF